jgi:hypothetical protein
MKKIIITSYEDACLATGRISNSLPDVSMMPLKHQKSILAYCMLVITLDAIRDNWEPDWLNSKQRKHYNWFDIVPDESGSGFVFSNTHSGYSNTITHSSIGSRLLFETEEQAIFAAKQPKILALYKDYLLLPPKSERRRDFIKTVLE